MQFFADAPLLPNMRTQIWSALWRPSRQARPTEQQPKNNDQEGGSKKSQPGKTARNFEATALSGQP
jgi:hypothetical protein